MRSRRIHPTRPATRWVAPAYALFAAVLVPWTGWLVTVLPTHHLALHWRIAWAGFDVGLAAALLGTAIAAYRRSPWLEAAAAAAGTFLLIDAWFDVLTSNTAFQLATSSVEAALIELPLAALSFWVARDAERACDCARRSAAALTARARSPLQRS